MEVNRDCVYQMTRYRMYLKWKVPKLFKLADQGDWDVIPARVQSHPRECNFRHRYAPGDTALHRLVRPLTSYTTDVSDSQKDDKPIHRPDGDQDDTSTSTTTEEETSWSATAAAAFLSRTDDDDDEQEEEDNDNDEQERVIARDLLLPAVKAIVQAYPQAALVPDQTFGRTPLHLACMALGTPGRVQVLQVLMEAAASNKDPLELDTLCDKRNRTPLHYLVEHAATLGSEQMQELFLEFGRGKLPPSKALLMRDYEGQTVLDLWQRQLSLSNPKDAERQEPLLDRLMTMVDNESKTITE